MSDAQSSANGMSMNRDLIGPVLGRTPSGVFILTVVDALGRSTGMLASWVQQASFNPPMVTVAVNAKRYVNDWLQETNVCVLNLVGAQQTGFLKHFGRGFEPDEAAFEGQTTKPGPDGVPVLTDALGWMAGRVTGRQVTGDHVLYAVEITTAAGSDLLESEKPMVHIRKNGFSY